MGFFQHHQPIMSKGPHDRKRHAFTNIWNRTCSELLGFMLTFPLRGRQSRPRYSIASSPRVSGPWCSSHPARRMVGQRMRSLRERSCCSILASRSTARIPELCWARPQSWCTGGSGRRPCRSFGKCSRVPPRLKIAAREARTGNTFTLPHILVLLWRPTDSVANKTGRNLTTWIFYLCCLIQLGERLAWWLIDCPQGFQDAVTQQNTHLKFAKDTFP